MKILVSLTYYSPYISGLSLYAKRLSEELVKRGFNVSVITNRYDRSFKSFETINGVKINRADYLLKINKGFLSWDWVVKSFLETKKSEMVIINLPQVEGLMTAFFAKMFKKKLLAVYHCDIRLPPAGINFLAQKIADGASLLILCLADTVITNTKDYAENSTILRKFPTKLKYIYPPVIKPTVFLKKQEKLAKLIKKGNYFLVGFIGRMSADKGIEYLLEAISYLRAKAPFNFKIVIAGPTAPAGEEEYKRKINRLIEEHQNDIALLGNLADDEVGAFYSLLDVLVLPSVNSTESFGMVQVEAMMLGVPVVASNLPGARVPLQKTGMGILVPPKDSGKIAEAITEIFLNKRKYLKNKNLAEKEFSFPKTMAFYEKLLL